MAIPLPESGPEPASLRRGRRREDADLTAVLRRRLMSDLHLGRLRPGDRLPSIRAVARESGADHRAVARAYRALEAEGLVEILGRSGVRVRREGAREPESDPSRERVRWLARVVAESWSRRVPTRDLLRMLEASAGGAGLRCACVESNRDEMVAYCAEIGRLSEMTLVPCYVAPLAAGEGEGARERLREELRGADLVVTTQYHAVAVREALGEDGPPLVVLRVDPQFAAAVRARLRDRRMTVVAATPEFAERLRLMFADALPTPDRLRVVLAGDEAGVRGLDPREPVLLTRAAREILPALHEGKRIFAHSPTLARESVEELTQIIVEVGTRE